MPAIPRPPVRPPARRPQSRAAPPMDRPQRVAGAVLARAVELVVSPLDRPLIDAAAGRAQEAAHRRRLDRALRRVDQDRLRLPPDQGALDEPEREAGGDLVTLQLLEAAPHRHDLGRDRRAAPGRRVQQVRRRLAVERARRVELGDRQREGRPELLAVVDLVVDPQRRADRRLLRQDAADADVPQHPAADHAADQQHADHQAEDAEQEVGLRVDRGQAHEHHHRAIDESGDAEVEARPRADDRRRSARPRRRVGGGRGGHRDSLSRPGRGRVSSALCPAT